MHRPAIGYKSKKSFVIKQFVKYGIIIQLVNRNSRLPGPKQQVEVSKWLNRQMRIYFNDHELNFIELKNKPAKESSKI